MKIVYGHQIFSVQKYGGISRYFYELARNIENISDNKIEIFSPLYINEYLLKSCQRFWGGKILSIQSIKNQ